MTYKFKIPIGDWSNDGHGKCAWYFAEADKPIDAVREAYFRAGELYPKLCPDSHSDGGGFATRYEDSLVPAEVVAEMVRVGFDAAQLGNEANDDGSFYFGSEDMAVYVVWFLNLGDPDLNAQLLQDDTPALSFGGYDEKMRHIGFIGYGCFY